MRVHASSVVITPLVGGDPVGLLLRGPSGAGKSDLALRLIEAGGRLIADDYTVIEAAGGRVIARAPATISGLIEARGVGLVSVPSVKEAPIGLIVDLVHADQIERLPEAASETVLGIALPRLALDPWPVSAVAKLRLAISLLRRDNI